MAVIGTVKKQPNETIPFSVDYTDVIGSDTESAVSHVVSSTPVGLTLSSPTYAAKKVTMLVSAGTANVDYLITVRTTMTLSVGVVVVEDEVRVKVRET